MISPDSCSQWSSDISAGSPTRSAARPGPRWEGGNRAAEGDVQLAGYAPTGSSFRVTTHLPGTGARGGHRDDRYQAEACPRIDKRQLRFVTGEQDITFPMDVTDPSRPWKFKPEGYLVVILTGISE